MFYVAMDVLSRVTETEEKGADPPLLLGPSYSGSVQLVSAVSFLYETPLLSYSATSPYLSSKVDYPGVWRTVASDALLTEAWVSWMKENAWGHAVVLHDDSLYSRGAAQWFQLTAKAQQIAVTVLPVESDNSRQTIRNSLAEIRKLGVKIIFSITLEVLDIVLEEAANTFMIGPSSFTARNSDSSVFLSPVPQPTRIPIHDEDGVRRRSDTLSTFSLNSSLNSKNLSEISSSKKETISSSSSSSSSSRRESIPRNFDKVNLKANVRPEDSRVQGYVWSFVDLFPNAWRPTHSKIVLGSVGFQDDARTMSREYEPSKFPREWEEAKEKLRRDYLAVNTSSPFRKPLTGGNTIGDPSLGRNTSLLDDAERETRLSSWSYYRSCSRALFAICDIVRDFYNENGNRFPNNTHIVEKLRNYTKENSFGEKFRFNENQELATPHLQVLSMGPKGVVTVGRWSPGEYRTDGEKQMIFADGTVRIPDDGIALESYVFTKSALGIAIISLSGLFGALLLVTLGITFKFYATPVFRLATPQLLLVMLLGLFALTVSIGPLVGRPSPATCALQTWPYYVGLALVFAPLAAKTWRVWRVFKHSDQLKAYTISIKRLGVYTAILVVIPTTLASFRLIYAPAKSQRMLSRDNSSVQVFCTLPAPWLAYCQLAVTALLMLLTLALAWLTRLVPDGFNETKHIFISAYSMSTIGLIGLVTAHIIGSNDVKLSNGFLALSGLLFAFTCWALLFFPKIFIALFKPHRNTLDMLRSKPAQEHDWEDFLSTSETLPRRIRG